MNARPATYNSRLLCISISSAGLAFDAQKIVSFLISVQGDWAAGREGGVEKGTAGLLSAVPFSSFLTYNY